MARIRSLKPEFWSDPGLGRLSRESRMLYMGTWNLADEHGRLHGDPMYLKVQVFPYDTDLGAGEVRDMLAELEREGKVVRYRVRGEAYVYLPKLERHQRLETAKVGPKHPGPDEADPDDPAPDPGGSTPDAHESAPDAQIFSDESALARARGQGSGVRGQGSGTTDVAAPHGADIELARPPTINERAQALARTYYEREPMCRFPAVMGVAKKAIQSGKYTDQVISDALLRLASEGRSVTTETLRIELEGLPPSRAPDRRSTTDDRVQAGLALAERLEAEEDP